jgi:hypothetical protein
MFPPASADGERTLDLRKTYMCSICLPQCGQALRPMSASHTSHSPSTVLFPACQGLRATQANPFIHDVNQQPATLKIRAAKLVFEVSTAKRRSKNAQQLFWNGGARRDRTDDLKLAKLPLSQLSYGPVSPTDNEAGSPGPSLDLVGLGRLELPTSRLSSARSNQLSYKPGTRRTGTKPIRTVLRPREKEKRRRRMVRNKPVTFRL